MGKPLRRLQLTMQYGGKDGLLLNRGLRERLVNEGENNNTRT